MSAPAGIASAVYDQALADVRTLRSYGTYLQPVDTRTPPTVGPHCGTRRGYERHLADGEHACETCKAAHAAAAWLLTNIGTTAAADTNSRKDSA